MATAVVERPVTVTTADRPAPRTLGRRRFWVAAYLAVVVGFGAFIRISDIGKFGFWTDEYMHVFAAKSYLATGQLDVPMQGHYPRAAAVSYLTAFMFRMFGESEATARLPFALINVGFILVAYALIKRLFSRPIALATVLVLSLSPLEVVMSRETRMYTLHQLLYFLTSVSFIVGIERLWTLPRLPAAVQRLEERYGVSFGFLALTVVLFIVSRRIHELTINFGIVIGAYVLSMFVLTAVRQGMRQAVLSKYGAMIFLAILGFVGMLVVNEEYIRRKMNSARLLHDWQAYKGYGGSFYRWMFTTEYPALVFLYPAGALALIRRYGKTGFFWVLSFAVLMVLHSYVFSRKADRYVFYIFPFFVAGAVALIDYGWPLLVSLWRERIVRKPRWERVALIAVTLPALYILGHPWARAGELVRHKAKFPDWKSLPPSIRRSLDESVAVTVNPREFIYYIGRYPEFYRLVEVKEDKTYEPTLVRDFIGFKKAIESSPNSMFVAAQWNFHNPAFLTERMREYVLAEMEPVPHAGDERILVYRRR